ncbi:MAG: hypothetical protein RIR09_2560 [Pseudomonadota bacterium]|jgi:hypothetical protein
MPLVRTPTNVTPANGATGVAVAPTLTGNAYGSVYGVAQQASRWQVDTTSDFASPVYDSGDISGGAVTHTVPSNLAANTLHYWRCMYRDSDNVDSAWSTGTSFTTGYPPD